MEHDDHRLGVLITLVCLLVATLLGAIILIGQVGNPPTPVTVRIPTVTPTATLIPTATPFVPHVPPPVIQASAAYMLDPATGDVLYSLHGTDQRAMASTTKIMTAIVTILMTTSLDQPVTVRSDVNQLSVDASRMYCEPGQVYSLRDLLYGLLLPSGDDAAVALADGVAGSQAAFVARMNVVAGWLQLTQTHFVNPHGLDTDGLVADGNYTSAADLAKLTEFAMQFPTFRQIVATGKYSIPATTTHGRLDLINTNEFLIFNPADASQNFTATGASLGVDGVKTGFTGNAGYCLVLDARHNGHDVVLVLLGEADTLAPQQRFTDGTALLTWIFAQEPLAG